MGAETLSSLIQRFASAPIQTDPYHHFYIEHVFPEDFYCKLLDNIPEISYFSQQDGYPQRFHLDLVQENLEQLPFAHFLFWQNFSKYFWSPKFMYSLLEKFRPQLEERFGKNFWETKLKLGIDASLIRDQSDYAIGPHTDHPNKIITLLFYLPSSHDQKHLGTSIYTPKDRNFKCEGYKHHSFENFDKGFTAPFIPNSVFGFFKSDISFHGLESIGKQSKERLLFCYNVWEQI